MISDVDDCVEETSTAEFLDELECYAHRLDHLVYLQERLRAAAEVEDAKAASWHG
jgi:hypothetical protein